MDRQHQSPSARWAARRAWVGQAPFTRKHICSPTWATAPTSTAACWPSASRRRGRQHHLQDPVQRRGGDDRRPARSASGPEADSVPQIQKSLIAEGVKKLVIVTDEPEKYDGVALEPLASPCTTATSSTRPARVPRDPAGLHGASSTTRPAPPRSAAAASAARRPRRPRRWSSTSWSARAAATARCRANCLSVEPVETEFGRKRRINQNTCNKDYSCVKGFCPSFVTVEGGTLKKAKKEKRGDLPVLPPLPEPAAAGREALGHRGRRRRRHRRHHHRPAAGVAAHLEGKAASSRRTPAAWRRRAAPPGATSRSPTGPRPSTPPRSTPPRPIW